ncbi:MAG TPA: CTP synthase (glutamine hydrolyzing) [Candidatus Nanoarchaeia archaeon]|nr:CTP synthase (glutamine hydrolyzing) [Candidatus Nanoarchaeia archaeon]
MTSGLFESTASKSEEHEFYTPIPHGYKPGKTKYVIVFGTVMSGLGKGIFSASLAKLLQMKGLNVAPVKFDGYLNYDAGTLNPYRHGEVFVLDDGTETDMDLGNYERFLDLTLSKDNYLTGGKIFSSVLAMERKGEYLGRDVQIIPHVTGEIKKFLRHLAILKNPDVIFVEVGGTVGDLENSYFIEAMRELAYEEGRENVCFIALTYILEPTFLGEQKSKAAQLGINKLISFGIQPSIIACRSHSPITNKVREKISIYSNVRPNHVVGIHDVKSVYEIPLLLKENNTDNEVVSILGLKVKDREMERKEFAKWSQFVQNLSGAKSEVTIAMTGKYTEIRDSYASILNALEHAGSSLRTKVNLKWIETTDIETGKKNLKEELKGVSGIIVPGGFGKRGVEGKIKCVEYARKNKIPYLGICLGFQIAVIEFARNVCGMKNANSTEFEAACSEPVIDILPEQLKVDLLGGTMRLGGRVVEIKKGTKAHQIYGSEKVRERFRHRYECNPKHIKKLEEKGMVFSGKAPGVPIMQILELKDHPFFMGVQYHCEFTSRALKPQPLFLSFVKAAKEF